MQAAQAAVVGQVQEAVAEWGEAAAGLLVFGVETLTAIGVWLEVLRVERPDLFDEAGVLAMDFAERLQVAPGVLPQVLPMPDAGLEVDALRRENVRLRRKLDAVRDGIAVIAERINHDLAGG